MNLRADYFCRIRNSLKAKKLYVIVLNSNHIADITKKISELGFFLLFNIIDFKKLKVFLKYIGKDSVLTFLLNLSKSKVFGYVKVKNIRKIIKHSLNNMFCFNLISTSIGILTDLEADLFGTGGKLIACIG